MGRMSSDSWASYRAAMPPECFGEPDDDPAPAGPAPTPIGYDVVWFAPVPCVDVSTGEEIEMTAPVGRWFARDRHARPYESASRWADAMRKRHRCVTVTEHLDNGESFELERPAPRTAPDPEF